MDYDGIYEKVKKTTVRLKEGNIIEKINACIDDNKDFIKNNILIMEYTEDLDIDDIAMIQDIKKKYKNIRINKVEE